MRLLLAVLLTFACLCSCSSSNAEATYEGYYRADILGENLDLTLERSGDNLSGTLIYRGIVGQVQASIVGEQATGAVLAKPFGRFPFEARLEGRKKLKWNYLAPLPGQVDALELTFKRMEKDDKPASPDSLDQSLIGKWRRTNAHALSGIRPSNNFNVVTDTFCELASDGTFTYGGSVTGGASTGFAGVTDPAGTITGQWKASDGVLYSRSGDDKNWIALGEYSFSGKALVLYAGTDKQLWER